MFKDVFKLKPAHAMRFSTIKWNIEDWRYWSPPDLAQDAQLLPTEDLLDELESLLHASVKRQLAAEVPIGILLSGGLDSSIVTALAVNRRARKDIYCSISRSTTA